MVHSRTHSNLSFALGVLFLLIVSTHCQLVRISHSQLLYDGNFGNANRTLTLLLEADITGKIEVATKNNRKFDLSFRVEHILSVSGGFDSLPSNMDTNSTLAKSASAENNSEEDLVTELLINMDFIPLDLHARYTNSDYSKPIVRLLPKCGEESNDNKSSEKSDVVILTADNATVHSSEDNVAVGDSSLEGNDDTANNDTLSEPWQIRLFFVPSTFCTSILFGLFDACEARFYLKKYSLRAAFSVTDKSSTEEIVDVWEPIEDDLENNWDSGAKSAFRCGNSSLNFERKTRGYFLRFKSLRIAATVGDAAAEFPYFSNAYAECSSNAPSTFARLLNAIVENMGRVMLVALLAIALSLALWYRARARRSLLSGHRYNVAVSPFTLDEFEEVDTAPFTENKKNKNFIRGIY